MQIDLTVDEIKHWLFTTMNGDTYWIDFCGDETVYDAFWVSLDCCCYMTSPRSPRDNPTLHSHDVMIVICRKFIRNIQWRQCVGYMYAYICILYRATRWRWTRRRRSSATVSSRRCWRGYLASFCCWRAAATCRTAGRTRPRRRVAASADSAKHSWWELASGGYLSAVAVGAVGQACLHVHVRQAVAHHCTIICMICVWPYSTGILPGFATCGLWERSDKCHDESETQVAQWLQCI